MKNLLILAVMMMLVSCGSTQVNELKKSAIENASNWGAEIIASGATCSNKDAIKLDIKEELESLRWLKPTNVSKSIAGDLCKAAIDGIVPKFVNYATKKLPERWECTGLFVEEMGIKFTKTICEKI